MCLRRERTRRETAQQRKSQRANKRAAQVEGNIRINDREAMADGILFLSSRRTSRRSGTARPELRIYNIRLQHTNIPLQSDPTLAVSSVSASLFLPPLERRHSLSPCTEYTPCHPPHVRTRAYSVLTKANIGVKLKEEKKGLPPQDQDRAA